MEWKSRKFIIIIASLIIIVIMRFVGKIDIPVFADLYKWVFGIYVFGNVANKGVNLLNKEGK